MKLEVSLLLKYSGTKFEKRKFVCMYELLNIKTLNIKNETNHAGSSYVRYYKN